MIPNEAVEAAKAAYAESLDDMRAALEAAAPHMLAEATKLIRDLTDPDDCWHDHHGGCQAHGYLSLEQGETCPQADAKEWAE